MTDSEEGRCRNSSQPVGAPDSGHVGRHVCDDQSFVLSDISSLPVSNGVVEIKIDESKLSWDPDEDGLVFDTASCVNCRASYSAWSFLGNMHVESVMNVFTTEPLLRESQLEEVILRSVDLFDVLWEIRAHKMIRRFRGARSGMMVSGPAGGSLQSMYSPGDGCCETIHKSDLS